MDKHFIPAGALCMRVCVCMCVCVCVCVRMCMYTLFVFASKQPDNFFKKKSKRESRAETDVDLRVYQLRVTNFRVAVSVYPTTVLIVRVFTVTFGAASSRNKKMRPAAPADSASTFVPFWCGCPYRHCARQHIY